MKKQALSLLTASALTLSLTTPTLAANDTNNHWAQDALNTWMAYGIIQGYEDGSLRPDNPVTRAELSAMLDRIMDYQTLATNRFTDLDNSWYTQSILGANAAGIIHGYEDGTVKPSATITRQEAVSMFARVLELDSSDTSTSTFVDGNEIAPWALGAVNAMAAKGYIQGSDGYFRPNAGITRAEVVTIFNNIFTRFYQSPGEYSGDVTGSVVINSDQVTLKDMTISGDLIIAEGVDDGHIVLDNVTVKGKLIVRGGGENSIIIRGNSRISLMSVSRQEGLVRVSVEGNAQMDTLTVNDRAQGVKIEGTVKDVQVTGSDADVEITGTVQNIHVAPEATSTRITIASEASVDTLYTAGQEIDINLFGQLDTVTVADEASDTSIEVDDHAQIESLHASGTNTSVNIVGTVGDMLVARNAQNADITVNRGSSVNSMTAAGTDTTIHVYGTLNTIEVTDTADRTTIKTQTGSKVQHVITAGTGTSVQGNGAVSKVEATKDATDTNVTTSGTRVENNSSESVGTNNGSVASGSTGTSSGNWDDDSSSDSDSSSDNTPDTPDDGDSDDGDEDIHTHSYHDVWTVTVSEDGTITYSKSCSCGESTIHPADGEAVNTVVVSDVTALRALLDMENITEIQIAEGIYTLDAQIRISDKANIKLIGLGGGVVFQKGETAWTDPSEASGDASLMTLENSGVVLKNITLSGAAHIADDYRHGLNIYQSEVSLDNVTLTNNAGVGMVVNGSTVKANDLHTSGNGWQAGVNIDNDSAYLSFDENSTFGETVPVYSDKGGVTVEAPGYVGLQQDGKYYWTKAFDGGLGTKAKPYEVANAQQFAVIKSLETEMKNKTYHFVQTADLELPTSAVKANLNGSYDGGGHSIALSQDPKNFTTLFLNTYGDTTVIHDLTLLQQNNRVLSLLDSNCAQSLTVQDINIKSADGQAVEVNANNFGFILINAMYEDWDGPNTAQTTLFKNIHNNVDLTNTGTCTGVIVGSGPCFNFADSSVTYRNCTNSGTITGTSYVGFFYGNPSYIPSVERDEQFVVDNCSNTGILMSARPGASVAPCPKSPDYPNYTLLDKYDREAIGGTYLVNDKFKDVTFTAHYADDMFQLETDSDLPEGTFSYKLVFNIAAIQWDDGYQSNGIKVLVPAAIASELTADTKITSAHAYDIDKAIANGIISEEEADTLSSNAEGAYQPYVTVKDDTAYVIYLNLPDGSVDSSSSLLAYVYEDDDLVGISNVS